MSQPHLNISYRGSEKAQRLQGMSRWKQSHSDQSLNDTRIGTHENVTTKSELQLYLQKTRHLIDTAMKSEETILRSISPRKSQKGKDASASKWSFRGSKESFSNTMNSIETTPRNNNKQIEFEQTDDYYQSCQTIETDVNNYEQNYLNYHHPVTAAAAAVSATTVPPPVNITSANLKRALKRIMSQKQGTSYERAKILRNSSLQQDKQSMSHVFKLARPTSLQLQDVKQLVNNSRLDRKLSLYTFNSPDELFIADIPLSARNLANSLDLSELGRRYMKTRQEAKTGEQRKVDTKSDKQREVQKMNSIISPYKIPSYKRANKRGQELFEITRQSVKTAMKSFRNYVEIEQDDFYKVPEKNPIFRVYSDGQSKLIDSFVQAQAAKQERFFYQQEHDPFIRDQTNYEVFERVGQTYMCPIPPLPVTQRRRFGREHSVLEREVQNLKTARSISQVSNSPKAAAAAAAATTTNQINSRSNIDDIHLSNEHSSMNESSKKMANKVLKFLPKFKKILSKNKQEESQGVSPYQTPIPLEISTQQLLSKTTSQHTDRYEASSNSNFQDTIE